MRTEPSFYPAAPEELYPMLLQQVEAVTQGVPYLIANLANVSAILNEALQDINWVGFYLMKEDRLVLGPFQGKAACVEIFPGRGVCGTAVSLDKTQLVYDVHEFPGHIACDCASNSEIVIPLRRAGQVVAVLDIDSPTVGRFTDRDREGLEALAPILEALFE